MLKKKFSSEKKFRDFFIKSCKLVKEIDFTLREESNTGQPDISLLKGGKRYGVELKIKRVNKIYKNQAIIHKYKNNFILTDSDDYFVLESHCGKKTKSTNIFIIINEIIK